MPDEPAPYPRPGAVQAAPFDFDTLCGAIHSDAGVCSCGWPGGDVLVPCLRVEAALSTLRAFGFEWRGGERWERTGAES